MAAAGQALRYHVRQGRSCNTAAPGEHLQQHRQKRHDHSPCTLLALHCDVILHSRLAKALPHVPTVFKVSHMKADGPPIRCLRPLLSSAYAPGHHILHPGISHCLLTELSCLSCCFHHTMCIAVSPPGWQQLHSQPRAHTLHHACQLSDASCTCSITSQPA